MLEFAKSLATFPWSMSVFGAQQVMNLLTPQTRCCSGGKTLPDLYTVTRATKDQYATTALLFAAYTIGDTLQSSLVDLSYDVLTLKAFAPSYLARMASNLAQRSTDAVQRLTPGPGLSQTWGLLQNTVAVINLVNQAHTTLQVPEGTTRYPLADLVDQAYALGQYPSLWAVEGLGEDFANWFYNSNLPPRNIMTGEAAKVLPESTLPMMHAGMGLTLSKKAIETVTPYSSKSEIRKMLEGYLALVRENSRPGYEGAALEQIGNATRTWYSQLVGPIDQALQEMDQDFLGYFWHGVGRGLYFNPVYQLPGFSAWKAADEEPPHDLGRLNARAGATWALTVVNIRQPWIMANFLKHMGDWVTQNDAFQNGVMSTLIMANDTVPNDVYIKKYSEYQPDPSDSRLVELWNSQIKPAFDPGIKHYYPALKAQHRMGEVFRYHPAGTLTDGPKKRV